MWVMWLKLEGALIIFERRSVFLWNNPSVNSFGQSDWNWQSTKYLIKNMDVQNCFRLDVFRQVYGVLVLMLLV